MQKDTSSPLEQRGHFTSQAEQTTPSLTGRAGGGSTTGRSIGGGSFLFLELIIITLVACVVLDPAIVNLYYRYLPMGYDTDRLLYAEASVGAYGEDVGDPYKATEERRVQLMRQLEVTEGVKSIYAYDNWFSSIGNSNPSYNQVLFEQDTVYLTNVNFIPDSHFFETYGIRPLPGSPSAEELSKLKDMSRQAVLTRSAALGLFGATDVTGRHFQILYSNEPCDMTVAGVVEDVRMGVATSLRSLLIMPDHLETTRVNIIVRLKDGVNPRRFIEEHGREFIANGKTDFCRISRLLTFRDHLQQTELDAGRPQEVNRSLALALFFLLNLILAVVGTVWLHAKRRTEECGVRRAFGATRRRLLLGFLGRGALMATAAVVIGCIIFLNYAYSGLQTDVDGSDYFDTMYCTYYCSTPSDRTWVEAFWPHFLVVSSCVYLIILLTVLIGTAIPAWRITRTNINEALKDE